MTTTVPIRTRSEANLREHWATKARRVKAQRHATRLCLVADSVEHGGVPPRGRLVIQITRIAPRVLDDDNLRPALKAVRDEVAAWLGLPDDRDQRVSWEYDQRRGKPGQYAVEIQITEADRRAA
jgi:hypothetical protein